MPIFTEVTGDPDTSCKGLKDKDLPILALRNMVMYPGVALPVSVGRHKSLKLIKEAQTKKTYIGVTCQKSVDVDDPGYDDLFPVGVIAEIIKVLEMPDNSTTVILQGKKRFFLNEITGTEPFLKGNIPYWKNISLNRMTKSSKHSLLPLKILRSIYCKI